ncbi:MAG: aspartyl protease family protein [Pyrinomonadaceae bacterium]|nr:aspartyl protease family protein [Pyrinomonadaceae bacterium]
MKFFFKSDYGLIYVRVGVSHGGKEAVLNLALDTGASATIISARRLAEIDCDLTKPEDEIYITTGSGLIFVPKIMVGKLTSLGKTKTNLVVIAHDLPPTASVDGVLGLDFLRENVLTVDFVKGEIELR